jgi:hypothetical protein
MGEGSLCSAEVALRSSREEIKQYLLLPRPEAPLLKAVWATNRYPLCEEG